MHQYTKKEKRTRLKRFQSHPLHIYPHDFEGHTLQS